jgi:transcriptional regulator with XRE-family HTH domain
MCETKNSVALNEQDTEEDARTLDMVSIGNRIRAARRERKLSQEKLAERCHCSTTHISYLENARSNVSLELLLEISIVLEQPMDYFLMDDPRVSMKLRLELELVEKLEKLNPQMVNLFSMLLDILLNLQNLAKKDR